MKQFLLISGVGFLVLAGSALQCDTAQQRGEFALQLKDPALLGEQWEVATGQVTMELVEEQGVVDLMAALDLQNAGQQPDGMADQVFVLQMEAVSPAPATRVLNEARTYYDRHGNVLVVALDQPFVLHLHLSENPHMTTEALLKEIGWQSPSVPTTARYQGYGLARNILGATDIPVEKSAEKSNEMTVFEVFQSCKPWQAGKDGSSLLPDQCNINGSTYQCSSGGDGATSCSISGTGGSCSVSCSGGRDACCDSGLTQCKCCNAT